MRAAVVLLALAGLIGCHRPVPAPVVERPAGLKPPPVEVPPQQQTEPPRYVQAATSTPTTVPVIPEPWLSLAECESHGQWNYGAPGTDVWGSTYYEGGLQWSPATWTWLAPQVLDDPPAHAWQADAAQEIAVARHYVDLEQAAGRGGWGPWPACARQIGLPR